MVVNEVPWSFDVHIEFEKVGDNWQLTYDPDNSTDFGDPVSHSPVVRASDTSCEVIPPVLSRRYAIQDAQF